MFSYRDLRHIKKKKKTILLFIFNIIIFKFKF